MHEDFQYLHVQHTIASPVRFVSIGLHSGKPVTMLIKPTVAHNGITFIRRDLPKGRDHFIAKWDRVSSTVLCTTVSNYYGHCISNIEHLLSAFSGLEIDNAEVILNGPDAPVMDGSALPFVTALCNAGVRPLDAMRDVYVIRRPVRVQQGECWAELMPYNVPRISLSIDFQQRDIGQQILSLCLSPSTYMREIAPARTFGFTEHLNNLQRHGLTQGRSIKNAILLRGGRVTNPEGLRFSDEFVRHKASDVIGDLALVRHPIIGHYRAHRPSHRLNNKLLRLLMNDFRSWRLITASDLIDNKTCYDDRTIMEGSGDQLSFR